MALFALITLGIAWLIGWAQQDTGIQPILNQIFPGAERIDPVSNGSYSAWNKKSDGKLLGYVRIGEADGYGGTMRIAVAVDTQGVVVNSVITDHKETYLFLRMVNRSGLLNSLKHKTYQDNLQSSNNINFVTGATITSRGIVNAIGSALFDVAEQDLGFTVPPLQKPKIIFGLAESMLIFLFVIGVISHNKNYRIRRVTRWISMFIGVIVFGFILNDPLTLNLINKLLLGFWPVWQVHLYWYLLIGGIVLLIIFSNRNPYCEWFCPFGAAQECFGLIGGVKVRSQLKYKQFLKWLPRGLAWLAIMLALLFRSPAVSNYEIFSSFFKLIGSNVQFLLLGLVLIAALFLNRPWCNFLCPLRPVTDIIKLFRNWIKELWSKSRPKIAG